MSPSEMSGSEMRRGLVRWAVKTLIMNLLLVVGAFWAAGRLDWLWGWVMTALLLGNLLLMGVWFIPTRPDLLIERSQAAENMADWDRFLALPMAVLGPLLIAVVAGLDERYGWSSVPLPLSIAAVVLAQAGTCWAIWAMAVNRFFSGVVRIQSERGHAVQTGGPYAVMRHPGYAGSALYDLAMPLMLGSWWGLIPALATIVVVVARTKLEDRKLQAELDGYADYARRVRYRLLPGVW